MSSSGEKARPPVDDDTLFDLLQRLSRGESSVEEVQTALAASGFVPELEAAQIDLARAARCGLSEAVFGAGKTIAELEEIVAAFLERSDQVLVTRLDEAKALELQQRWPHGRWHQRAGVWCCRARGGSALPQDEDGSNETLTVPAGYYDVAVVCAGTSDLAAAEEAAVVLEFAGVSVARFRDVGIAGLHRLVHRLEEIRRARVVITAAGMDGALPTVIAGLVRAPVIALPTSIGYGSSFEGLAALLTMLNACAGGIATVNIDNGYGAAAMALKILAVPAAETFESHLPAASSNIASP